MKALTTVFGAIVPTFFAEDGVSLSEVARLQAEAKQQNDPFWGKVSDAVSGVFQKVITFLGGGEASRKIEGATLTPEEIREYAGVADRNAVTATLMHAVKLHQRLGDELERMDLRHFVAGSLPEAPIAPDRPKLGTVCSTKDFMEEDNIDKMIATLSSEVLAQFDFAFWQKANGLNSRAAVLGKLLSEQGSFFRKVVEPLPKGSEQVTQNGVVITTWERSYDSNAQGQLFATRDELQAEYDDLQKQLNSCKKQIKDAVRGYNLEQERAYQVAHGTYQVAKSTYDLEVERIRSAAETFRQEAQQELASLRVRTA